MKQLRSLDRRILRNWLPIAFVATLLIGLMYVVVQQNLRLSANDPQIQLAEDAANNLANGTSVNSLSSLDKVDISSSLAPFAAVFNEQGQVVVSSGKLGTKDLSLPSGVFAYTKNHNEDVFTWQPQSGVRIAAVLHSYKRGDTTGYVLVGRNLREVEKRENQLLIICAIGWGITLVGSLGLRLLITPKQ